MDSSIADLFPPGTDLCKLPTGLPPAGQTIDLGGHSSLQTGVIAIVVIATFVSTLLACGRFYVNIKTLAWDDGKTPCPGSCTSCMQTAKCGP